MIVLPTIEERVNKGWAKAVWWENFCRNVETPYDLDAYSNYCNELHARIVAWGGTYDYSTDTVTFERDEDATMFLLRWS